MTGEQHILIHCACFKRKIVDLQIPADQSLLMSQLTGPFPVNPHILEGCCDQRRVALDQKVTG
jgi:hypothetical protein